MDVEKLKAIVELVQQTPEDSRSLLWVVLMGEYLPDMMGFFVFGLLGFVIIRIARMVQISCSAAHQISRHLGLDVVTTWCYRHTEQCIDEIKSLKGE